MMILLRIAGVWGASRASGGDILITLINGAYENCNPSALQTQHGRRLL